MKCFSILLVVAATFGFAPMSFAAQVVKVKGKSALINLQGQAVSAGDRFFATENGKNKALLQIAKVSGDKAIAKVLKGTANPGQSLAPASGGGGGSSRPARAERSNGIRSTDVSGKSRSYWGLMLGYAMDTMNVNVKKYTDGSAFGTAALSGTGFAVKGLFDYEIFPQVWFRGLVGVDMFNVSGDSKCGVNNAQTCDAKLMYGAADFIGRYVFTAGNFRPWLGLGIGLLFPASKSATALDASSIGTTNVILPTAGFDFFISPTMYIPVSVEYGLLPKSDEVDAHWIAVHAGLAIPF